MPVGHHEDICSTTLSHISKVKIWYEKKVKSAYLSNSGNNNNDNNNYNNHNNNKRHF